MPQISLGESNPRSPLRQLWYQTIAPTILDTSIVSCFAYIRFFIFKFRFLFTTQRFRKEHVFFIWVSWIISELYVFLNFIIKENVIFDIFFFTNDLWKKYNQPSVFFINNVKFKISFNFEHLLVKNYNITLVT